MTDEQIINGVKCCAKLISNCRQCSYRFNEDDEFDCEEELGRDTLDLINRQKAEIEELKNRNAFLENEYKNQGELFWERVKIKQSEAIKEFAERLKETAYSYSDISGYRSTVVDADNIDKLVKEICDNDRE